MRSNIIILMKLQCTRFELFFGRVLSCTLGRKPYRCVWLAGVVVVDVGPSTCVGTFKTLLNRSTFIEVHKLLKSGRSGEQVIPGGMWVPVAVWQPCELLYTCCFLTYLVAREEINVELTFLRWTFPSCYYLLSIRLVLSICFTLVDERFSMFLCFFRVSKMFLVGLAQWLKW